MISTIKICFALYYDNIKNVIKSEFNEYDLDNMTINMIESEIEIIHMKYILSSVFSVSPTSVQFMAYNHLMSLIKKYHEINEHSSKHVESKNETIKDAEVKDGKTKGWFYSS